MPDAKLEGRSRAERANTPQPVEVAFVRSGRGARAAIQEWRSRTTGRIHEVPERHTYAPAGMLVEGATGWLTYAGGVPWVGETKDEALRMAQRVTTRPPSVRGAATSAGTQRARVPWMLVFVLALIAAIVWAMMR